MKTYIHLFFCCLLFLACFAWSSESFRVEVKDEQPTNNDILGLRMRIINNSGQQYNNVQVKYYLKKQPTDNLVLDLLASESVVQVGDRSIRKTNPIIPAVYSRKR